jgi:hypothetical protein
MKLSSLFLFPFEYYDVRFGEEYTKKKRKKERQDPLESCLLEGKTTCFSLIVHSGLFL